MKGKINKQTQTITIDIIYANDFQKELFPMETILGAFKTAIENSHRFNKLDITFGAITNAENTATKR